ncbi:MAG: hypothetical protein K6B52_05355 [Clostridiales bacterium]|nr:hypothetical protein [Clostridiales bacterium]
MKTLKRVLCVVLSVMTFFTCLAFSSSAQNSGKQGTFSVINANVAGLPDFGVLNLGEYSLSTKDRAKLFGKAFNESGADIVAVQEDFAGSRYLFGEMKNYLSRTINGGGVPFGGGLNIFSKKRLYNVKRYPWRKSYGVYYEGDALAPKGIVYAVVEIADGIFVDVYDLHADAFDTKESQDARVDNFNQTLEAIEKNGINRPVILTGDFNVYFSLEQNGDASATQLKKNFIEKLNMKEAWIELYNNGDYDSFTDYNALGIGQWGNWDSVEKFFYCDGGGIHIEPTSFEFVVYNDENGNRLSDHNAAFAEFTYTVTDDYSSSVSSGLKKEIFNPFKSVYEGFLRIIKDLYLAFSNIDELIGILKGASNG